MTKTYREKIYRVNMRDLAIEMSLEYYDGPLNNALRFLERSSYTRFCLSAQGETNRHCVPDFIGSIAIARYRLSAAQTQPSSSQIRESVRTIDQCDGMPARPPFERLIPFENGSASDIQAFGYERTQSPPQADLWCLFRQNLYLNHQAAPFLTLHWKHTFSAIRVLDIIAENGASLR